MTIGPILETDRLFLRPPATEDFEACVSFIAYPYFSSFIFVVQPRSMAFMVLCVMS